MTLPKKTLATEWPFECPRRKTESVLSYASSESTSTSFTPTDDMSSRSCEGGCAATAHSGYILHSWPHRMAIPSTHGCDPSPVESTTLVPRKSWYDASRRWGWEPPPPRPRRRRTSSASLETRNEYGVSESPPLPPSARLERGLDSPVRSFSPARTEPCALVTSTSQGGVSPERRRI